MYALALCIWLFSTFIFVISVYTINRCKMLGIDPKDLLGDEYDIYGTMRVSGIVCFISFIIMVQMMSGYSLN